MAIVDTVWGRITRCNPLGNPADFDSPRPVRPISPGAESAARMPKSARRPRILIAIAALRWLTAAAIVALLAWGAMREMATSHLQAKLFSRWAGGLTFGVADGASEAIRFPKGGPYDERLGYAGLPGFIESLTAHGFKIESQARWSPGLVETVDHKLFPIYDEKDRAGLRILDPKGGEIYRAQFPERVFPDFASIPSLVVNTLLFVEDRYVLDRQNPERNPAIEWKRFALAAAGQVAELVVSDADAGGASTLATQIEKFRHSPGGRTGGGMDKLRQMITASLRAYYDGPDTLEAAGRDRHGLSELDPARLDAGLWRDHRLARRAVGLVRHRSRAAGGGAEHRRRAPPPNSRVRARSIVRFWRSSCRGAARAITCSTTGPRSA